MVVGFCISFCKFRLLIRVLVAGGNCDVERVVVKILFVNRLM